jgi:hypothetical protein
MAGSAEARGEADAIAGALGATEGTTTVAIEPFGATALGGAPLHPPKTIITVRAVHVGLIVVPLMHLSR